MLQTRHKQTVAWQAVLRLPMLILRFAQPQKMLSWALVRPGLVVADAVAWLQVRDSDLAPHVDAQAFLADRLRDAGLAHAVGLMTSRNVTHHHQAVVTIGGVTACAMVTLGLSNGEAVEPSPGGKPHAAGTINLVCHVSAPLAEPAMLEALSIAATARTAALLARGYQRTSGGGPIIGTGTDCIVLACPPAQENVQQHSYAGLHTPAGQAIAQACHAASADALSLWLEQQPTRQ